MTAPNRPLSIQCGHQARQPISASFRLRNSGIPNKSHFRKVDPSELQMCASDMPGSLDESAKGRFAYG